MCLTWVVEVCVPHLGSGGVCALEVCVPHLGSGGMCASSG